MQTGADVQGAPRRMRPPPVVRSLPPHQLPLLLSADASLYPSPLTLSTLSSWVATCPDFALQYTLPQNIRKSQGSDVDQDEVVGVCIVLPVLAQHWNELISGRLKEWDVGPEMLWRPVSGSPAPDGIGLHVWHIERFGGWDGKAWGKFGLLALRDIQRVLDKFGIGSQGSALVKGYSALAVTEDGRRLFMDQLQWKQEPAYDGQWVLKDARTQRTWIVEKSDYSGKTVEENILIQGNCTMLVQRHGSQLRHK
ncbi:hypothetical protein DFH27DRAFT_349057 [Peziza echinospora]|nr:hypothetical protein DFH27DRAFT_349057 [Peziza echinospora]